METGTSDTSTSRTGVYYATQATSDPKALGENVSPPALMAAQAGPGPAQISMRWSDDRGVTWSNPVIQTIGAQGETYGSRRMTKRV